MKKTLLVFALVGCMIMAISCAAMASNAYVGGVVGGKWDNNIADQDDDLDLGFIVGGEYNFLDKFKVGLEYLSGTEKDMGNDDLDYDSYEVKFGYRVLENDKFNMDVTLSYYDENYDSDDNDEVDGVILGTDLSYLFNDKFSLSGSLGFSVDGTYSSDNQTYDDNDADILIVKAQGNYNINERWSAFLGYHYVNSDVDHADDFSNQSILLGAAYKF
jgi:long-subunit fatty acid transport protein